MYSAATSRDAPDEDAAENGRTGARRAGDEREHLEHADEQRIRPAQRSDRIYAWLAAVIIPLDKQEADAIEQQHQGHDGWIIEVLVEPIVQRQADEHGRQAGNRDLQPHDDLVHTAITVAEALQAAHEAVRALLGEPRALRDALTVEGPELAPVEHHNSKDRAELDDDVEHLLERIRLLQRPDGVRQDQMARAADGKPLRDALHDAEHDDLQPFDKIHEKAFFPVICSFYANTGKV